MDTRPQVTTPAAPLVAGGPPRAIGGRLLTRTILAALLWAIVVGPVAAHPLGNFTVNHHVGVRVERERVRLDVVIDRAEIPTFEVLNELDADGDGDILGAELEAARVDGCGAVGSALELQVGQASVPLGLVEAGVSFPPGLGGLWTMRLVCVFEAPLRAPIDGPTRVVLTDGFEAGRTGWNEVVPSGDGLVVDAPGLPTSSPTDRLTRYPPGLSVPTETAPRTASFTVAPGGDPLAAFDVPDAEPLDPPAPSPGASSPGSPSAPTASSPGSPSAPTPSLVAGGTASDGRPPGEGPIPEALGAAPVDPWIALLAVATAALLGAGHALTPGHGKTLIAASLVGMRGSRRHALGLGLAMAVSHTAGILVLALVVLGAQAWLPSDAVVRAAPLVAAVGIVAVGAWMLAREGRRQLARRRAGRDGGALEHDPAHDHGPAHGHPQGLPHPHPDRASAADDERGLAWRSLAALGLAGGLVPSANALLVLLATVAAGRPAWGIVLVVAFGVGMAGVMTGIGLALVSARGLGGRLPLPSVAARLGAIAPLGASALVLAIGLAMTAEALGLSPIG